MKKILQILLLVPILFTACQVGTIGVNEEVSIDLCFDIESDATRTNDNSPSANGGLDNLSVQDYDLRYILEIYPKDEKTGEISSEKIQKMQKIVTDFSSSPNTTMNIRLLPGKYQFVIFADFVNAVQRGVIHADLNYNTEDLRHISILNTAIHGESRDCYYATDDVEIKVDAPIQTFHLTRPLAKLRVVSTDATKYGNCQSVSVTYQSAPISGFNALTGKVIADETLSVATVSANVPDYAEPTGEKTLFIDYLFVDGTLDASFQFNTYSTAVDAQQPTLINEYQFNSGVTLRTNALTTIKGSI